MIFNDVRRVAQSVGRVIATSALVWGAPALADPAQQLSRAMAEVRAAQGSSDVDEIQQHLRYAENCIVGRDSGYYYAPDGDTGPCTDRQSVREQVTDPLAKQRLRTLENTIGSARMQRNVMSAHDAAEDAGSLIGQIQGSSGGGGTAIPRSARPSVPAQASTNARDAAYAQKIANARAVAMPRGAASRQATTTSRGANPASAMPASVSGSSMDATFRRLLIAKYGGGGVNRGGLEIAAVQIGAPIHANPRDAREWEVNLNQSVYPVHTRYSLVSRSGAASSIRDWDTHYVLFISPITHQWDISSAVQAEDVDGVLRGAGPAG